CWLIRPAVGVMKVAWPRIGSTPPPGSMMPPGGTAPPPLLPLPAPGTSVGVGSGVGSGVAPAPAALHALRISTVRRTGTARRVVMAARRRGSGSGSGVGQRVDTGWMGGLPGVDRRPLAQQVAELVGALEQHDLRERVDVERQVLVARQVHDLRV